MEKFTLFVVSTKGLLVCEAKILLKQLNKRLTEKWEWPPSQAHNYVHTNTGVAIARDSHFFLHSLQIPSNMSRF